MHSLGLELITYRVDQVVGDQCDKQMSGDATFFVMINRAQAQLTLIVRLLKLTAAAHDELFFLKHRTPASAV